MSTPSCDWRNGGQGCGPSEPGSPMEAGRNLTSGDGGIHDLPGSGGLGVILQAEAVRRCDREGLWRHLHERSLGRLGETEVLRPARQAATPGARVIGAKAVSQCIEPGWSRGPGWLPGSGRPEPRPRSRSRLPSPRQGGGFPGRVGVGGGVHAIVIAATSEGSHPTARAMARTSGQWPAPSPGQSISPKGWRLPSPPQSQVRPPRDGPPGPPPWSSRR